MDKADLQSLRASVRAMLEQPAEGLLARLDELGWSELTTQEPEASVTVLFEEHGRLLGRAAILDHVVIGQLGDDVPRPLGGVMHSWRGAPAENGRATGVLTAPLDPTRSVLLPSPDGEHVCTVDGAVVDVRAVDTLDAADSWSLASAPIDALVHHDDVPWAPVEALARRALAAELVGLAEKMLDLAIVYTGQRVQYGRAIASFQTVRHRFAEAYAEIAGARALLEASFRTDDVRAARAAKAFAGIAAETTARHAVQTFGAIGSTQEHELHHYVARATAIDALLGSHRATTRAFGEALLAGQKAPLLVDL
jgi:hypothetical protein